MVVSWLNPLAFAAMWTGLALVFWSFAKGAYPGIREHLKYAALSVPFWWWFELVNERTNNWRYHYPNEADFTAIKGMTVIARSNFLHLPEPAVLWYVLLSSIAFATVVPAVAGAIALVAPRAADDAPATVSRRLARIELCVGLTLQILVFVLPRYLYPLIWLAPLLIVDGVGGLLRRRSYMLGVLRSGWRDVTLIGLAGLLCGICWELLNSRAVPRWEYSVPFLGFWKIFEMPLLGFGGYVPFAWLVYVLIQLTRSSEPLSNRPADVRATR